MKKLVLFTLLVTIMVSCAPTTPLYQEASYVVRTYEYSESTARNLEPEHTMLLTPLIADLEVSSKKIYYTEKEAFADVVVDESVIQNIDEFKKIALCRAAQQHKADVLVGAMIEVETIDERLVITISGYPAYYKNFRNATVKDTELIKVSQIFRNDLGVAVVQ
ncbi:MAG: hypothetical protein J6K24_06105 [Tidjanibacter sp.]|nr:hypothetical protein [Tidjanibacter sp.]